MVRRAERRATTLGERRVEQVAPLAARRLAVRRTLERRDSSASGCKFARQNACGTPSWRDVGRGCWKVLGKLTEERGLATSAEAAESKETAGVAEPIQDGIVDAELVGGEVHYRSHPTWVHPPPLSHTTASPTSKYPRHETHVPAYFALIRMRLTFGFGEGGGGGGGGGFGDDGGGEGGDWYDDT